MKAHRMTDLADSSTSVLQQFVDHASTLYSLPAVAMEVLELTRHERVDIRALKQCVQRDPALTAKLLRVVNSSLFGLSGEVSDLNQALTLLGVKPLKLLVLGFSLPKSLFSTVEAETLERYWRFTLVKAVAARQLAEECWKTSGDEAFIAGLLQEIGLLVLVRELGPSYIDFVQHGLEQKADLLTLETDTLGFDHTILSARLLEHWQLPKSIVRAVSYPPNANLLMTLDVAQQMLPQALHLATLIASILVDDRKDLVGELMETANRYCHITSKQIDSMLDELQDRVEIMAEVFSVQARDEQRYRDIIAQAHEQLAEVATDSLSDMLAGQSTELATKRAALEDALGHYSIQPRSQTSQVSETEGTQNREHPSADDDRRPGNRPVKPCITLSAQIRNALAECRATRHDLSVLLLEIEDYQQLLLMQGLERVSQMMDAIPRMICQHCEQTGPCIRTTDTRFAIVLAGHDRRQAITVSKSLLVCLSAWSVEPNRLSYPIRCSIGVAAADMPGRSYTPSEFIEAAERCLFAAQASGGGMVKSIDIL